MNPISYFNNRRQSERRGRTARGRGRLQEMEKCLNGNRRSRGTKQQASLVRKQNKHSEEAGRLYKGDIDHKRIFFLPFITTELLLEFTFDYTPTLGKSEINPKASRTLLLTKANRLHILDQLITDEKSELLRSKSSLLWWKHTRERDENRRSWRLDACCSTRLWALVRCRLKFLFKVLLKLCFVCNGV